MNKLILVPHWRITVTDDGQIFVRDLQDQFTVRSWELTIEEAKALSETLKDAYERAQNPDVWHERAEGTEEWDKAGWD